MVFLQTSCSKEQSENANAASLKTVPISLSQQHEDVVALVDQYELYANQEVYDYPSLSIDDAEWIIEAVFNYKHVIENSPIAEYTIMHEDATPFAINGSTSIEGTYYISSADLFAGFAALEELTADEVNLAPMSDIAIVGDGSGNFILRAGMARIMELGPPAVDFPSRKNYSAYHRAVGPNPIVGPGPGNPSLPCPGTTGSDGAHEILQHNLRIDITPTFVVINGYYTSIRQETFGDNAFNPSSYTGFLSADYSLSIWGAHPSVNPLSTATGLGDECISQAEMQDYEAAIKDIFDIETPFHAKKVWEINVDYEHVTVYPPSAPSYDWYFHKLSFKTGIFHSL